MSQQLQITGGAKVRNLEGVLTGTSGVVNALGINVPSGIPQLDGSGKILVSQLPNSVMEYKGSWNAATNTPTLVNGTGNAGDVYLCEVAGTVNFGAGPITFAIGDQVIYSGTTWQRASGATGTVTSVAVSRDGDALTITGSPITTSGTINIGFSGSNGQYINGEGDLVTFPSLTGFVPYTGATANVDLGIYSLSAGELNIEKNGTNTSAINFEQATGTSILGAGYTSIGPIGTDGVTFFFGGATNSLTFKNNLLSASRSYSLPDASGTLALTSNLSSYVPYTGATANVNLGGFGLSSSSLSVTFFSSFNANILLKKVGLGSTTPTYVSQFAASSGVGIGYSDGTGGGNFIFPTASINDYTFPDLSGTLALLEGTQTFTGNKRFDTGVLIKNGVSPSSSGYTGIGAGTSGITVNLGSGGGGYLIFQSTSYDYTFPASSGTIALTSNLSSYVPYTGATANVDLGNNILTSGNLIANGVSGLAGMIHLKNGTNLPSAGDGYASIGATPYNSLTLAFYNNPTNGKFANFDFNSLTNSTSRSYTFPDASGTLALTSDLSGYVPYTGATANLNLGTFDLTADVITGATGSFASSGGSNTFAINHSSGSGIALNITKGGNGEGLYINKTSGSGNAATIIGTLNATTLVKNGGTSSQFLKADGSVDSNSYVTIDTTQTITGAKTFSLDITVNGVSIGTGPNPTSIVNFTNTRVGKFALTQNTTGTHNTAIGYGSIGNNTTGGGNIAMGINSLQLNTTGSFNTALGSYSLLNNTTGDDNTAVGFTSLSSNTTGIHNTTIGFDSLSANTTGNENTGLGHSALKSNTTGQYNTALGSSALYYLTTGSLNIAIGRQAGLNITTGSYNTIIGNYAGTAALANNIVLADGQGNIRYQFNGTSNVFTNPISATTATFSSSITVSGISVGTAGNGSNIKLGDTNFGAITTGSNNIAIGSSALSSITTSNANIGIGNSALASVVDGAFNIALGFGVGASITSGSNNTLFGYGAGQSITTGNYNTILGAYAGTAGMSNNIVLSDGQGNVRYQWNGTNNVFTGAATFSSSVTVGGGFNLTGNQKLYTYQDVAGQYTLIGSEYAPGNGNNKAEVRFGIESNTNTFLSFATALGAGTINERMRITSSGNVGIGTTAPLAKATVRGGNLGNSVSMASTVLSVQGNDQGIFMGSYNGTPSYGSWIQAGREAFDIPFNLVLQPNGGSVGIGTSSPTELLEMRGANRDITSGEFNQIIYSTSSQDLGRGASIGLGGYYTGTSLLTSFGGIKGAKENGFGDNTAGYLSLHTRPNGGAMTERMRITSEGLMLLGATSSYTSYGLIQITGDNKGIAIRDSDGFYRAIYNQSGTLYFYNGSNEGYLNTAGAWVNASDVSIKKDVKDLEYGLKEVLKLKPKSYKMIDNDLAQIGFIAQEVGEILPELVDESKKGMKGLSYGQMTAVLVKAIQEQQAQIEELKQIILNK
jgi:hypothetical protein